MIVTVLGTEYRIHESSPAKDPVLKDADGYCDPSVTLTRGGNWSIVKHKMIQKGIDAKQINNDIEYLRKALGGNKIAEKNIFSKSPSGAL